MEGELERQLIIGNLKELHLKSPLQNGNLDPNASEWFYQCVSRVVPRETAGVTPKKLLAVQTPTTLLSC